MCIRDREQQNQLLIKRNHELAAEVDDLRAGQEAIEERARTQLGLIGDGEQFIQVIDQASSASGQTGVRDNQAENEQP